MFNVILIFLFPIPYKFDFTTTIQYVIGKYRLHEMYIKNNVYSTEWFYSLDKENNSLAKSISVISYIILLFKKCAVSRKHIPRSVSGISALV